MNIHVKKLFVLADDTGKILAAHVPGLREGNPPQVKIVPLSGQVVREVEMPQELTGVDFAAADFSKYRVRIEEGEAKLVQHRTRSG